MDLRAVAATFETTPFDVFNEATQLWGASTTYGKIFPIDHFLSNFNRPTKRRLLGLAPDASIPSSRTIRVPATTEIYFIGELRKDSQNGAAYDQIGVAHRATDIGTVTRMAPVGSSNDPGWLVATVVGRHYLDVELRSSAEIDENTDKFEGNFFLMAPAHADLQEWDRVTLAGEDYMVNTVYDDSGFKFARVVKRPDQRENFVYHHRGAGAAYNPATGAVTDGLTSYNVTGFAKGFALDALNYTTIKSGDLRVTIQQDHIGVTPSAEDELTWGGQRYKVKGVQQDFLKNQFKLHCTL